MKKLLLSLLSVMVSLSAFSADIVETFNKTTKFTPALPTSAGTAGVEATYTSGTTNIAYTMVDCYLSGGNYLMVVGGSGTFSFALPMECSAIKLKTSGNLSTSAYNTIMIKASETGIVSAYKINVPNKEFTFELPAGCQAAGTVITIKSDSSGKNVKNPQFVELTYVEKTTEPTMVLRDAGPYNFAVPMGGSQSATLEVVAANLTEDIAVIVSGTGFSASKTSIAADAADKTVVVTYTGGTSAGTATGSIRFVSDDLVAEAVLDAVSVAHAGTETDPLTTDDVMAMQNRNNSTFYVQGTIANGCAANNGALSETVVTSNIAFTTSDPNLFVPVALVANTETRNILNLDENPGVIGQTIIVTGSLESYFTFTGIKNTTYISGLGKIKQPAGIEWSRDAVTLNLGDDFTAPTLSNPNDLAVTYASSNPEVATVAADGTVTIVAIGETTITATTEENDDYLAGSASYTLTVLAAGGAYGLPFNETFAGTLGEFVAQNVALDGVTSVWVANTGYVKATGYVSGTGTDAGNHATDAYLVSPVISLETATAPVLSFDHVIRYFTSVESAAQAVKVCARIKGSADWEDLTIPTFSTNTNWTFVNSGEISLANFKGFQMQVAFHYTSTATEAGTWEIKNLTISEAKSGIDAVAADSNAAPVEFYNIQGVRVNEGNMAPGLYIRRQGNKVAKVVVK